MTKDILVEHILRKVTILNLKPTPSALDPYGGAMTGIVGVNRDILGTGLGARPIANTDVFCFGPPNWSGELPSTLFHPSRVLRGVHAGVRVGGNESGIPTINGSIP